MIAPLYSFLIREDSGLKQFLREEGQHTDVEVKAGHDLARDVYAIDVWCHDCERKWSLDITYHSVSSGTAEQIVVRQVLPFVKKIARTLCFRFSLAAELAEWLTKRVAEAGAKGVKYSALVAEAVDMHLCAPQDVDAMLERLGFRVDFGGARFTATPADLPTLVEVCHIGGKLVHDGWVMLPPDHPQRRNHA